jgi:uridine kinase
MRLVSTPRIEFLRALGAEILHNYGRGRSLIAVEGAMRPVREAFADDLAAVFEEAGHPVFRASMRYFQRSEDDQEQFGPETAERIYRRRDDYEVLRRVLLDPFRMGGSAGFVTRQFDPDSRTWIEPTWTTAPPDASLIVDGEFLHRSELRNLWAYTVLLEGPPGGEMVAAAGGGALAGAYALYGAETDPRGLASALVDTSDPEHPARSFADSC